MLTSMDLGLELGLEIVVHERSICGDALSSSLTDLGEEPLAHSKSG